MKLLAHAFTLLSIGVTSAVVQADAILVPPGGDIQSAIDSLGDGDTVQLQAGTYLPTSTIRTNGKAITIAGVVDSQGRPSSVIDGQRNIQIIRCVAGDGPDTVFRNLEIRRSGGSAPGLLNIGANPTIENCAFVECSPGMRNTQGSRPDVSRCRFFDNVTGGNGAGMHNMEGSSPTVTNCVFLENLSGNAGGGMSNENSNPTVRECIFTENTGTAGGGGIDNNESDPLIEGCVFVRHPSGLDAGGITNRNSAPTIVDCIFHQNDTTGILNVSSNPTITDCTFSENFGPSTRGGGMDNRFSDPVVRNCLFVENRADAFGGGVKNQRGTPEFIDCTFTGNTARLEGSAVYNEGSETVIQNCEIMNNVCDRTADPTRLGGAVSSLGDGVAILEGSTICDNSRTQVIGGFVSNGGNVIAESCGCLADVDGNGMVDGGDMGVLVAFWGTNDPHADVDDDGTVDGTDLQLILAAWGPCGDPARLGRGCDRIGFEPRRCP